jgi:hypothetical protein
MGPTAETVTWLCRSDEPWTRYRSLVDLGCRARDDAHLARARLDVIADGRVRALVARASNWPGYALKRHNDAAHPIYALSTLADFGLDRNVPGVSAIGRAVLSHFDGDGFETYLWLPRFLTKEDEDTERWGWMLCDSPTLLYALLSFGYASDPRVQQAVTTLVDIVGPRGWQCGAASSLPRFSGPGRNADPCPMATVYALKALSLVPQARNSDAVALGVETILAHWEHQADFKLRMFGIGTDFRKIKYPYVWYDILHVAEVLSRYERAVTDERFVDLIRALAAQADEDGRVAAGSMYRAWSDWSFSDKKRPSPWLTFLMARILNRIAAAASTSTSH